jgi:hypothetical protein
LGWDDVDEFVQFAAKEVSPSEVDMTIQAHGFVLSQDQHLSQAAVEAVGEYKVDDAVISAEGYCRLGSISSKWF